MRYPDLRMLRREGVFKNAPGALVAFPRPGQVAQGLEHRAQVVYERCVQSARRHVGPGSDGGSVPAGLG